VLSDLLLFLFCFLCFFLLLSAIHPPGCLSDLIICSHDSYSSIYLVSTHPFTHSFIHHFSEKSYILKLSLNLPPDIHIYNDNNTLCETVQNNNPYFQVNNTTTLIMQREGYVPPSNSNPGRSSGPGGGSGSYGGGIIDKQSSAMKYLCADCGKGVTINKGDPIRCKECGFRILYKERTKRYDGFFSSTFACFYSNLSRLLGCFIPYMMTDHDFFTEWYNLKLDDGTMSRSSFILRW